MAPTRRRMVPMATSRESANTGIDVIAVIGVALRRSAVSRRSAVPLDGRDTANATGVGVANQTRVESLPVHRDHTSVPLAWRRVEDHTGDPDAVMMTGSCSPWS